MKWRKEVFSFKNKQKITINTH